MAERARPSCTAAKVSAKEAQGRVVISGRAARQAMSEKAPGTPWKAITLSAAAGAFLLASDITCKLSPSRVRRRPGQRQDLGCEASVGQRRRGRESALSGCQQSPCPLQIGRAHV